MSGDVRRSREGTPRAGRWRTVLSAILLAAAGAAAAIGGCIRRYPAPAEPPEATMPYSAVATWRGIELPPAGDPPGPALPLAAARLAIGPGHEDVFADTALLDGRDAARVADGREAALALLGEGDGPVVLLIDPRVLGTGGWDWCMHLVPLADRLVVAAGRSGFADGGPEERADVTASSRDPLSALPLRALCPGAPPPSAPPRAQPWPAAETGS